MLKNKSRSKTRIANPNPDPNAQQNKERFNPIPSSPPQTNDTCIEYAYRIGEIDDKNISLHKRRNNGRTAPVRHAGDYLVFETSYLQTKTDLGQTPFPDIYQIDTYFKGDSESRMKRWFDFIERLESSISLLVEKEGINWFCDNNVFCKSIIREENGTYFIRWPVNLKTVDFIDENEKPFNPSELSAGDSIKLIVKIPDLWISDNCYGLAIKVMKVKVRKQKIAKRYRFNDTNTSESSTTDESEENIISLLATEQAPRKKSSKSKSPYNKPNRMIEKQSHHQQSHHQPQSNSKIKQYSGERVRGVQHRPFVPNEALVDSRMVSKDIEGNFNDFSSISSKGDEWDGDDMVFDDDFN